MNGKTVKAHLAMLAAKTFGGLNSNALKYLLPFWISSFTMVTFRLIWGAIAFWIIGLFVKNEPKTTAKEKLQMFFLGALGIFGYMSFYTWGLRHTTPVSSSIIMSLVPIWTFLILLCMKNEKINFMKALGLFLGLGGTCINIFTPKAPQYADNPILGDMLTVAATFVYSFYLIFSRKLLKKVGIVSITKWTFFGAGCASIIAIFFIGYDARLFHNPLYWLPIALFVFIEIFPTVGTYILQPYGLKYLKTTAVAMYGYWVIIVSAVTALIVKQDQFQWTILLSIGLLCVGIYLVEVSESKIKKDSKEIKEDEDKIKSDADKLKDDEEKIKSDIK